MLSIKALSLSLDAETCKISDEQPWLLIYPWNQSYVVSSTASLYTSVMMVNLIIPAMLNFEFCPYPGCFSFYIFCCSTTVLNNFASTLRMRNSNNFSTIICLCLNKKSTRLKVFSGPSLILEWICWLVLNLLRRYKSFVRGIQVVFLKLLESYFFYFCLLLYYSKLYCQLSAGNEWSKVLLPKEIGGTILLKIAGRVDIQSLIM